jgi:hypothetical protein
MWASISSRIPTNIKPKGQLDGSTTGVTYDCVADPDCCELASSSFDPEDSSEVGLFPWRAPKARGF